MYIFPIYSPNWNLQSHILRGYLKNCPGLIFHRIPAANAENKLLRQRCIQNIHRKDPLPKDETFYVCANHFEKYCFHRDLKVCNFVSAYLTCILLVYKILSYRLEFLKTAFPTSVNPWINNPSSVTYYISALAFSLLQPRHKQSF